MFDASQIKYLCLDLDGTLLDSSKSIDEDTISILRRCIAGGIKVVLVSGRHFREIIPYSKEIGLTPDDYVISCDGEYIHKCDGTRVWSSNKLFYSDVINLWSLLGVDSLSITSDRQDVYIARSFVKRWRSRVIGLVRGFDSKCWSIDNPALTGISDIEKIIVCIKDLSLSEGLSTQFTIHNLDEGRIEILPMGVNKYEALLALEQLGEVKLEEAIYFGNDNNDIECFENMSMTVAMKDSSRDILIKASYITESCDNHGVYKAINELFC